MDVVECKDGWHTSMSVIHCIEEWGDKSHLIISIADKWAFGKIQQLYVIKVLKS